MIERLSLRNWRSYKEATVEFGAGTTFVVASNGVGKTSLIEAVRFALFDVIERDSGSPVRVGSRSAHVAVELKLPNGGILTVERSITAGNRKSSRPAAARLDGNQLSSDALVSILADAYRADPVILARLTMPAVDRDDDKPTALRLEEHLGRYFGVDNLKSGIAMLNGHQKAVEASIKQIKAAKTADVRQIARFQSDADQAARDVELAEEQRELLRGRIANALKREQFDVELRTWHAQKTIAEETAARLSNQMVPDLGGPVSPDELESVLEQRRADLDGQIEEVRIASAVKEAQARALSANDERLDAAHDDCPVCRRPLDETTVQAAHGTNAREIAALRAELERLESGVTALSALREQVKSAQAEWRGVPRLMEQPRRPEFTDEALPAAELQTMMETAENAVVEARAAHKLAVRALEEAREADERERRLLELFGRQAKLKVAADATAATLAELIDQTIQPLAGELSERWSGLFQDRGRLSTSSNGQIAREVEDGALPYESFSTGERMGAIILLRLLVVEMVTSIDFCWFDEPLEHLDPNVRRKMADLLSRATGEGNPLKQIVVTTYEEPLVRRLHARDTERVRIIDVRQSPS